MGAILSRRVGHWRAEATDSREYVVNANWNLRPQTSAVVNAELQAFVLSKPSAMPAWWLVCVNYILPPIRRGTRPPRIAKFTIESAGFYD